MKLKSVRNFSYIKFSHSLFLSMWTRRTHRENHTSGCFCGGGNIPTHRHHIPTLTKFTARQSRKHNEAINKPYLCYKSASAYTPTLLLNLREAQMPTRQIPLHLRNVNGNSFVIVFFDFIGGFNITIQVFFILFFIVLIVLLNRF